MTAASFYTGAVSHRRRGRIRHRLRYRVAYVLIDVDRFDEAGRLSRFLGVDRKGLMSVRQQDHGDGRSGLGPWVRRVLRDRGIDRSAATVKMLTMPRMFGYVFNPLSVYFVYGDDASLHTLVYEVNNTFGGRHVYVCDANLHGNIAHHSCDKKFYVSPFYNVGGRYRFSVTAPRDALSLSIAYADENGDPAMTASLSAQRLDVTNRSVLAILLKFPLATLGVIAGIHWEAVKLWLKGARYRSEDEARGAHGKQRVSPPSTGVKKERLAA